MTSLLHLHRRPIPELCRTRTRGTHGGAAVVIPVRHAQVTAAHAAATFGFRVHGGPQVDDEGEDVGGEDESDDPLEDGSGVTLLDARADGEGDDEGEFEEDEAELYVEGGAKDPVFSVVWLTSQGICPKCSNVRG